jgi:hypothetical protein
MRMGAAAVGPDQGTGRTGVDQRLIPEEPMSIVLNLGISGAWVRFGWLDGWGLMGVCRELAGCGYDDYDVPVRVFD